jgi:hypothetical protein
VRFPIEYFFHKKGIHGHFSPLLNSIDVALHSLEKRKTSRRVIRGIYDYPRIGTLIKGELGPDIQEVNCRSSLSANTKTAKKVSHF